MADILKGLVLNVIDSDTIEIMVTQLISGNKYEYGDRERVRITNITDKDLQPLTGERSRETLEQIVKGKEVRCFVQSMDTFGRIMAEVRVP